MQNSSALYLCLFDQGMLEKSTFLGAFWTQNNQHHLFQWTKLLLFWLCNHHCPRIKPRYLQEKLIQGWMLACKQILVLIQYCHHSDAARYNICYLRDYLTKKREKDHKFCCVWSKKTPQTNPTEPVLQTCWILEDERQGRKRSCLLISILVQTQHIPHLPCKIYGIWVNNLYSFHAIYSLHALHCWVHCKWGLLQCWCPSVNSNMIFQVYNLLFPSH